MWGDVMGRAKENEKKLTISDVAEALGVSKTTVSRAISGKGRIGAETKERVLAFIQEHNYKPNVLLALCCQRITLWWTCHFSKPA